jgi:conjugative transfer region protein (TIGR03748 family)
MPMRQRIFMLVVLLTSHPVVASDAVQVGRYLTVAPIPTAEQLEPLSVIVNVRFPRSVHTVGGALQHLLPPSGYQLADTRHADPQLAVLTTRPLPEVHRQIGPMTLQEALSTLAGEGWQLEVDPVYRLVSFRLQAALRERYAQVEPPVWTPEPSVHQDERPTVGWFEAPVADAMVSGDRYGPVRRDETLLEIALHLVESRYWSEPKRGPAWPRGAAACESRCVSGHRRHPEPEPAAHRRVPADPPRGRRCRDSAG